MYDSYRIGYEARGAGAQVTENPYGSEDDRRQNWHNGWNDADAELDTLREDGYFTEFPEEDPDNG